PRLNNMKSVIFAALLAVAACRPQDEVEVSLIREESDPIVGFNFRHEYELDNGVSHSVVGSADDAGEQQVITGSYTLPLPEGGYATVTFVANALGFSAESPLLPVAPVNPHPIPAHAQEQIDFSNAQLAAGLVWDQAVNAWV
ncbi:unnamed protein product, partial [Meganyctiphanes norvegica]